MFGLPDTVHIFNWLQNRYKRQKQARNGVYKSQNCFYKTNFFIGQIQREFEYIFSKFKCIFPLFPLVRNTREEIVLVFLLARSCYFYEGITPKHGTI